MTDESRIQYAVTTFSQGYSFSVFHQTKDEALEEARRLCRKTQKEFLVLKLVARLGPDKLPIKEEVWE